MPPNTFAERIRITRDTSEVFPVEEDDMEVQIQIYEPDDEKYISMHFPILVDSNCTTVRRTEEGFSGLSDINKSFYKEHKYAPSSRILFVALTEAYKLMKQGDERAKRFLDKFMNRKSIEGTLAERVATDAGFYGVVHHDEKGKGIYSTDCPECGTIDHLWKGTTARTLQIITGIKEPDLLIELSKQYQQEKPILMSPERNIRAVHIGYTGPLDILFGYYPDIYGTGRGISNDMVREKK